MKKSYDELIKNLQKQEAVPSALFNNIIFTIQNKQAKRQKTPSSGWVMVLSPILTSVLVFVLFIGVSTLDAKKSSEYRDRLLQMSDTTYYDKYFLTINDEFLF